MNRQPDRKRFGEGEFRTVWMVLTAVFTVLLVIQLIRWARGGGRADSMLVPATFIVMGLAHILRLKGAAQKIMLVVSALFALLAVVLLLIR